ncbi:MAG: alpha/beta fold hydrolase [Actinobacteria bacterium]|nr:alpha/beta fold hydrolase [Actinomycetota bacterium]
MARPFVPTRMEEPITANHREARPSGAVDTRVEGVVANWFPRFLANGLDYLDVTRILDAIENWDQWGTTWEAAGENYEKLGRDALAAGHSETAGSHLRRAALTYQFAQFVMTGDTEARRRIHLRMADTYRTAAPLLQPPATPVRVPWRGIDLVGYLRTLSDDSPLVVLIPGLESTKEQFSTFEPFLLERGLSTLSFEGPGQGETWYEHGFRDEAYVDAMRALFAWIVDRPDLSGRRVALLGTSFGGYLALKSAPGLPVEAVVDIAGFFDLKDFDNLQPVIRDNFAHFMKIEPAEIEDVVSQVDLLGTLPLDVPVLAVHGEVDPIVPVEHAHRIAAAQMNATVWLYPDGTHSCNNLHTIVRPAISDWLADRLAVGA